MVNLYDRTAGNMVGKFGKILVVIAVLAPASALAMSAADQHHCRVIAGEKLPATAGGAQAICTAIEQAVAAQAPTVHFSAEVKVVTKSMLATTLVVNGRALPEQKFAVTDRELNESSIKRFAKSIATQVAAAARQ